VLSPADFGIFAVAQFCIDLAAATSYAMVGVPILQRKRLRSADYANALTLALLLGVAGAAAIALAANLIERWLATPQLAPLLYVTALLIPARCLASFFIAVLQRHIRVQSIIWAQTRSQITSALGVTLVCALLGFGAWSLLLGLAASTFLELFWCFRASRICPPLALGEEARQILTHGSAALSGAMIHFATDSLDRMVVGAMFGTSPLGIFTRAANLVQLPLTLIGYPASSALMSWFSRIKGQHERVYRALSTTVEFQGLLLPPIAIGCCLASPLMVHLLLGAQWTAAIPLAQILFIGGIARLGVTALDSAALPLGHAWTTARRLLVAAGVLVIGLALAAPWSLLWVAVAVTMSRLVYYILLLRYGVSKLELSPTPMILAHVKGLVIAIIGAAGAVGGGLLLPVPSELAENLVLPFLYCVTVSALILLGPTRLVDPVGSFVIALLRRLPRGWLAQKS
jgi:PST family polysaccharide transporter